MKAILVFFHRIVTPQSVKDHQKIDEKYVITFLLTSFHVNVMIGYKKKSVFQN